MRDLRFTVVKQKLRLLNEPRGLIAGTKGYLRCVFDFQDQDWGPCQKMAVFSDTEPVLIPSNTCNVPDAVTDSRTI